ncbi:hypothetical protein [Caballeronia sp. RCC_10]|uniref:hypothetical protein n=1 Tax=Caballeronia sp. RCC_10 TaxID=3239227 RepID=UPI0035264F74
MTTPTAHRAPRRASDAAMCCVSPCKLVDSAKNRRANKNGDVPETVAIFVDDVGARARIERASGAGQRVIGL